MNLILFIFIILASTFIASSANNMVSVMTALDNYFEKAEVPDYWIVTPSETEAERFKEFADNNHFNFRENQLIQTDPANVTINGKELKYSNTLCLSSLSGSYKVFKQNDEELTNINDGELYMTAQLFYSSSHKYQIGDQIKIDINGKTKTFTLAGSVKDVLYGSAMIGMTRFLISENDYAEFVPETTPRFYSMNIYTQDDSFSDRLNEENLDLIFNSDREMIKTMYIMDMVTAAVLMIVSICLILISMVILRFTIHFTINGEFREIGVMKAIGIPHQKIRWLYIVKYLALSAVGSILGLFLSIPFGKMMIGNLSKNIILTDGRFFYLNFVCSLAIVLIVIWFCYLCTRKIRGFSPIEAIRNGETGQRYSRKSFIRLNSSHIPTIPFLALNDIFSSLKQFAAMILIFILGTLLIATPVNTINTLQSDSLVTSFSMAKCDHIINREILFHLDTSNRQMVEDSLDDIRGKLLKHNIHADVFQEILFRLNVSYKNKHMSSLAFQGVGDVRTDQYTYLEGTPPQNNDEVAITHIISERLGAGIGDTITIKNGSQEKNYIVTALNQSMNNMGEGIRFYGKEQLDYNQAIGSFAIQIRYTDDPGSNELQKRKDLLKNLYPDTKIYSPGEYINLMIGDIAGQLQEIKYLILIVILCINMLVTVLMVKSFLAKERGEIAILKAIGFKNASLVAWQTLRIGIILILSILIGTLLSSPFSEITSGQVFQIMGAKTISFDIVPLEVYVIYPLAVFSATVLSALITALQIRNIPASDTTNIE